MTVVKYRWKAGNVGHEFLWSMLTVRRQPYSFGEGTALASSRSRDFFDRDRPVTHHCGPRSWVPKRTRERMEGRSSLLETSRGTRSQNLTGF